MYLMLFVIYQLAIAIVYFCNDVRVFNFVIFCIVDSLTGCQ